MIGDGRVDHRPVGDVTHVTGALGGNADLDSDAQPLGHPLRNQRRAGGPANGSTVRWEQEEHTDMLPDHESPRRPVPNAIRAAALPRAK